MESVMPRQPKKVVTITQVKDQPCDNQRQALSQLRRIKWGIEFRNENQKIFWNTIDKSDVTFCAGPAGCGKTYVAVYYALQKLAEKSNSIDGIIITKPLVEVGGEKLGHLPGDVDEKTAPFMQSFYYNMEQIIGKRRMEVLCNSGVIKVIPLAYMRGITLTDKIVILDESQNAQPGQLKTFLTRIGHGSKFVVTGDLMQSDIKTQNGLDDAVRRLSGVNGLGLCQFELKDVVRHQIVSEIIDRYEHDFYLGDVSAEETISRYVKKYITGKSNEVWTNIQ